MSIKSQDVIEVVSKRQGLTAREILKELPSEGLLSHFKSRKTQVNQALYRLKADDILYSVEVEGKPRWYLKDSTTRKSNGGRKLSKHSTRDTSTKKLGLYKNLHAWQKDALHWWKNHDYCGVVEAVTGAGKTRLALAAVEMQIRRSKPTVVVVPTRDLMRQWEKEIKEQLAVNLGLNVSIGLLGDGRKDHLEDNDVLITTPHSGSRYLLLPEGWDGLIIADEVHHYGAALWSRVLEEDFDRRLGLTATYEREDLGIEDFLDPYFGNNIFRVDYQRALQDNVIAPFKIAFVAVEFSASERETYDVAEKKARKYRNELIKNYEITEEPFGTFMQEVQKLKSAQTNGSWEAGQYLSAFSKRRQALAAAEQKFTKVSSLSNAIKKADKTILFAQTQKASKSAIDQLTNQGIKGAVLTSDMDMSERKDVFAAFEDSEHGVIAAPRLLDEGVDVPSADLAIVLASSRSKRQMVQRMGRVVRKKSDGRLARLLVLYVEGTSEDPNQAHEDFLYLVKDVAHDTKYFASNASPRKICKYLNDWTP